MTCCWSPAGWGWRRSGRRCTGCWPNGSGSVAPCCSTERAARTISCSAASLNAGAAGSTWRSRSRSIMRGGTGAAMSGW